MQSDAMISAAALRAPFEQPRPATVGMEEELMLLDAQTLDLAPDAPAALEAVHGDPRFKLELPAAQLEIATPACPTIAAAAAQLAAARTALGAALAGPPPARRRGRPSVRRRPRRAQPGAAL